MLRIDLTPLEEGLHQCTFTPEPDALGVDPARFADVQVEVQVNYYDDRALVLLQAAAQATLECDRTLEVFTQPVEGAYQLLYAEPAFAERHGSEGADDYEEVRVLDPTDRRIDLTEVVRDTLVLALPRRRIAPGAEELELQTTYGAPSDDGQAAIDPRWKALRALRTDEDEAS